MARRAVLPKEYSHTYDLFVALAMAAAATTRIKVASGICLLVERDPIITAKEVASLDHLSGGRVLFGIGAGWNAEEMEHHGTVFRTRWKLLKERVLALKAIWTEDEASFDGEFVRFEPIWSWPKPVQRPHPPVILGAHGPKALARVVDYCDGWIPIGVRAGDLPREIAALRRLAEEKGRDPRHDLGQRVRDARATPTRSGRCATRASRARSSPCLPPAPRRSCRCSTATPRWCDRWRREA